MFNATDPRDKIYACISLAKPVSGFDIDYVSPFQQTYTAFVAAYIKQSNSLSILKEAGLHTSTRDSDDRLPSWVPDWRYGRNSPRLRAALNHASLDTKPLFSVSSDKLAAKGILCDEIATLEPNQGKVIANWLKLAVSGQSETYVPMSIPQLQAYFRTLFVDWNPRTNARLDPKDKSFFSPALEFCGIIATDDNTAKLLPDYIVSFAAESGRMLAQAIFICMLQQDDPDVENAYWAWEAEAEVPNFRLKKDLKPASLLFKLGALAKHRCFLMIGSGYMGLAPAGTNKGDLICILLGCCVPVVLRYFEGDYLLIGECFVMGLMDGEIFDGIDWEARLFISLLFERIPRRLFGAPVPSTLPITQAQNTEIFAWKLGCPEWF